MPLSETCLEKPRKPSGLRQFCDDQRKDAAFNDVERKLSHLRKGVGRSYQVYFTEIVPLALFSSKYYDDTVNIQPVLGSQTYDARVKKWGVTLEKIEITKPHDGKALSEELNLLATRGYGELGLGTPLQLLQRLEPIIKTTAENKASKNYSGAVLVFALTYDPPFPCQEKAIFELLMKYLELLKSYKFKARRVVMFDMISGEVYEVQRGNFIHSLLRVLIGKSQ